MGTEPRPKPVWYEKRQGRSPQRTQQEARSGFIRRVASTGPEAWEEEHGLEACGPSGPRAPGSSSRSGPSAGTPRALLLQNALEARWFDKAQIRADKRQLCPHSLGSCHPEPPWGCTCGIWMFLSQRPGERKTAIQHLINYLSCHCFCWPRSDTSPLLTVDNHHSLIASCSLLTELQRQREALIRRCLFGTLNQAKLCLSLGTILSWRAAPRPTLAPTRLLSWPKGCTWFPGDH